MRVHHAELQRLGAAGLVALAMSTAGCQSGRPRAANPIVEPETLAKPAPGPTRVVDVRPRPQYEAGHVDRALHIDLAEWTAASRTADQSLRNTAWWRERIGAAGVDAHDRVLIYDGGEMTEAARLWFVLQLMGATQARVVNGGWKALSAALPPERIAVGAPPAYRPQRFAPDGCDAVVGLAGKADVRRSLEARDRVVLDVRTPGEYAGTDLRKNPRGGHLPGAVNLSHTNFLDAQGRLKPAAELRQIFEQAGIKPGQPIVAHCQSGGRSSLAALAAVAAGFGPVSNYYMSFGEWSADESCPIEH
jgi:thiosulfate/3-mercaptopyruvate sulfurtransferase